MLVRFADVRNRLPKEGHLQPVDALVYYVSSILFVLPYFTEGILTDMKTLPEITSAILRQECPSLWLVMQVLAVSILTPHIGGCICRRDGNAGSHATKIYGRSISNSSGVCWAADRAVDWVQRINGRKVVDRRSQAASTLQHFLLLFQRDSACFQVPTHWSLWVTLEVFDLELSNRAKN